MLSFDYLTAAQLADRLGCSMRSLYTWVREGTVPAPTLMLGQRRLWHENDVKHLFTKRIRFVRR